MFMVSAVELVCIATGRSYLFGIRGVLGQRCGGRGFRSTHYAGYERFDQCAQQAHPAMPCLDAMYFLVNFCDSCFERTAQSMAVNHYSLFGKHTADTVVMLEKAFQNDAMSAQMILSFQRNQPNQQQKTRTTLDILTFLKESTI